MQASVEKFVQLSDGPRGLHALGADGGVYRYIPEDKSKGRFAFWSRLTNHRPAARSGERSVPAAGD